jgi:hypothetical protein
MGFRQSVKRSFLIAATCLIAACSKPEKVVNGFQQLQGCGAATTFEKNLEARWKEKRHQMGLLADGKTLVTLYTSKDGESWTLTYSNQKGIQCAVASGAYWTDAPIP